MPSLVLYVTDGKIGHVIQLDTAYLKCDDILVVVCTLYEILGGEDTPYAGGVFKLEIQIPDRYPFEPPKIRFVTPIYHPNIDTAGRICLDTLKMPPKGAWKPILNISTVLTSIQLLMAEPNPEDPLMTDISNEFTHNRSLYVQTAREWTNRHAKQKTATEQHGNFEAGDNLRDNVYADGKTVSSRKRSLPMDDVTNIPAKLP